MQVLRSGYKQQDTAHLDSGAIHAMHRHAVKDGIHLAARIGGGLAVQRPLDVALPRRQCTRSGSVRCRLLGAPLAQPPHRMVRADTFGHLASTQHPAPRACLVVHDDDHEALLLQLRQPLRHSRVGVHPVAGAACVGQAHPADRMKRNAQTRGARECGSAASQCGGATAGPANKLDRRLGQHECGWGSMKVRVASGGRPATSRCQPPAQHIGKRR